MLVIDAGGDLNNAVVGGILSFYAASIGVAGMVIDGAIRDVAEIRERDIPGLCARRHASRALQGRPGRDQRAGSVGGMVVNPGDIVVGDQDGLLGYPASKASSELIEKALAAPARPKRKPCRP